MTKTLFSKMSFGIIALFILIAAMSRLLPHPPNFTPIGGMALFGMAYFSKKYWALLIPIISIWLSDLVLNNVVYSQYYDSFVWFNINSLWIYGAFMLIAGIAYFTLKKMKITHLLGTSILASVLFFLITNLGVWFSGTMYTKDISGLIACYTAGVPFFWNTLAGDLCYTALLFGAYELIRRYWLTTSTVNG